MHYATGINTLVPFSDLSGVPINTCFEKGDETDLVDALSNSVKSGTVLVAWEHKDIQALVSALGVPNAPSYDGESQVIFI
jgi:hypothetical protein